MNPSRILIIRLSALGDIVHGLPVLAAIRRARPEAFIGWLVEDRGADLLREHPMLDAVHVVPRRAMRTNLLKSLAGPVRDLRRRLREARYDAAIDLQGLTKSAVWAKLSGARRRIGFRGEDARELSRWFYNASAERRPEEFHVVRRNLSLLRALGIEDPTIEFPVHLPPEAKARAERIWGEAGGDRPRVLINPGAGWPTKMWPAARYGRLARTLAEEAGARVALAWGPGEQPLIEEAMAAAGAPARFDRETIAPEPGVSALPPTSFIELGAVAERAQLFVGGDTGPTHLAAALGAPVVGLYGASDSRRNGPRGDRCTVIQLDAPPCIPCWKTRCHWSEPLACLTGIDTDRVRRACLKLLENA